MDGMTDIFADKPRTVADEFNEQFRNRDYVPEFFDTREEFLRHATQLFSYDVDSDKRNREQAIEDMKFMAGDQWEDQVLNQRIADRQPTLTLNRLPAFIGQLVGNRKLNQTEIKIIPENDEDKDAARIREGLIRSIQKNSLSEFSYDKAYENAAVCGMGNFKVELEYATDDVFEQDIRIKPIPNPLAVVWDRFSVMPDGSDAKHCFIVDKISREDFKREYPDSVGATLSDIRDYLTGQGISTEWAENDAFRMVEYWYMTTRRRIVALVNPPEGQQGEQKVMDITETPEDEIQDIMKRIVPDQNGLPTMREIDRKVAVMHLITATDILEGPYELPISRLPVFRAQGWETQVGEERIRFGLIRFMKDPQRLHNFWRSTIAEKLMSTPRGNWIATEDAVEGREDEWNESHLTKNNLLIYNSGQPAPSRIPPHQLEPALIEQAGLASQDLHDISNMHQASLGQTSNEVSARAINARQRIGEAGTIIYETNLQMAIESCGIVLNELIPLVYDTARVIKVIGEDGKEIAPQLINDAANPNSVDITLGKYSVSAVTGPSTASKRAEAVESMYNMVNAAPQTLAVALDKIVEYSDWPGASEIAARLRSQLPPGVLSQDDLTPEEQQAQAITQQLQQQEQERQNVRDAAEINERNARAQQSMALAQQAMANTAKTYSEVGIKASELALKAESESEKNFLQIIAQLQNLMTPVMTGDNNDGQ